jgi:hypothetical protein
MEPFLVRVLHDGRYRTLKVKEILNDGAHEQYELIGRDRSVLIESNRPHLRKLGLKHKRPSWRIIQGKVLLLGLLDKYIEEIMKVVDR